MIRVRPFRNTDPPLLADLWRSQSPQRRLVQPMSARLLESHVFSKPYFDRLGLLVAEGDEGRVIGFAHAGFGPSEDLSTLSTEMGVVCLLLVAPDQSFGDIAGPLLDAAEDYLSSQGSKVIYAGGVYPLNPFYLGLYGGSELPGVLESDERSLSFYRGRGYQPADRVVVMQRELAGFRPLVDRTQMQIRRSYQIEATLDPPSSSWWEACTLGHAERTRFHLLPRAGDAPAASATFWHIEPLASSWGVHAVGVLDLEVAAEHRRRGLATFLMGESLRQLQSHGATLVEAQTMERNAPAVGLYQKLGFEQVDAGVVLRKSAPGR
ncbi:MAG: GNAT family N-acetyltransferase [Planctomycetes bacterium]|nr:GNAT family N-acetyltransferase [Planctomycetota bacterium]